MLIKRILLPLVAAAFVPVCANAQVFNSSNNSKKALKATIERLTRERDSLANIIDGGYIELSDTTSLNDTLNVGELGFINSHIFENVTPGCNPDSLLSVWYNSRNAQDEEYIVNDTIELFSNIPDSIYIEKIKRMNSFIPIPYNHIVRNQIIAYTEKMPTFSKRVLGLSDYYLPIFEEIFDSYNMPKELKAMAIIESALNPVAISRARAKGMWQFMYRTALQYGLKINSFIDERLDPIKSADAAARYLRDAYAIYGDWALAISSYNCGTGNVNKAIRRAGSKEFWDIYPYLPRETRGYVPAFVGALYLLNYYREYNLEPTPAPLPPHVDTFQIRKNLHFEQISEYVGIPMETLKSLNPQYINNIIPGNERPYILTLPYNYTTAFVEKEDSVYTYKDSVYFNPVVYNKIKTAGALASGQTIYHKVKKGETLGGIASKYRVSLANLRRWNGLGSKNIIRIGQRLVIYGNGAPANRAPSKSGNATAATSTSGGYTYYTIKKGDTLSGIAYKCGVSLNTLLSLNGLTTKSKIYPGKKLKVRKN